jgi:hypothetical protein
MRRAIITAKRRYFGVFLHRPLDVALAPLTARRSIFPGSSNDFDLIRDF